MTCFIMLAIKNTIELARTCLCKTNYCLKRLPLQAYVNSSHPLSSVPRRSAVRRNVQLSTQTRLWCLKSNEILTYGYSNSSKSYAIFNYRLSRFMTSDASVKENATPDPEHPKTVYTQCSDVVNRNLQQDQSDGLQAVSDKEVEEELLRYDYENVEDISDEPATVPQVSKKPLPISLESMYAVQSVLMS